MKHLELMKKITFSIYLVFIHVMSVFAQENHCTTKLGGVYFTDCKKFIFAGEQEVLNIRAIEGQMYLLSFQVYNPNRQRIAEIKDNEFVTGNKEQFIIKKTEDEFLLEEISTQRILLYFKRVEKEELYECLYHLWLDFYMPDGNIFQASPEESNLKVLQNMRGASFKRIGTCIHLN
jgi:hypothetical protein